MPFPVVKLYANVTHVFESTGNFRFHEAYKSIIILMYHLSTRFLENVEPKSVFFAEYNTELHCVWAVTWE